MRLTRRGWMLAALTALLYVFANQTQVGWLYVLSAIGAGLWLSALVGPGAMLRRLTAQRRVNGAADPAELELYAGQPLTVELTLKNLSRVTATQIRGMEHCPPAPRADRDQPFFLRALAPGASVTLSYETVCARRGWFDFPVIRLTSRAPYGFASARREAPAPTGLLVFPEVREIDRLPLFDRAPAPQNTFARVGLGGEFVGVREYRPGDSPRHVHWRSTARAGRLIVREFAEETQPGLAIALDLRAASALGPDEDSSLELAVKAAASLARYADRRGLPVSLAANSALWPAPPGPLSWWGLMNYLARVRAGGAESFAACLGGLRAAPYLAAILPAPDPEAAAPLLEARRAGLGVLAVLIDPAPYDASQSEAASALAAALAAGGVDVRVIGAEPDWERALSEPAPEGTVRAGRGGDRSV